MLSDWMCYVRERILIPKIVILWTLLSAGGWFVMGGVLPRMVCAVVIAGLSLIAFRLMDDLADQTHDSAVHPERCLVQTRYINSFWAMSVCLAMALIMLTTLWFDSSRGLGMLLLAVALYALGMAYRTAANRRAIVAAAVLLKYPAVILLMAKEPEQVSTIILAIVFYAILLADEVLA